ncbi:MAG: hypothetical protein QOJ64_431 [Acidobacteriota bacterium]|jgi:hypothetical protein|nr:hypothetical protein [Acidobacteriota bacterium]
MCSLSAGGQGAKPFDSMPYPAAPIALGDGGRAAWKYLLVCGSFDEL